MRVDAQGELKPELVGLSRTYYYAFPNGALQ